MGNILGSRLRKRRQTTNIEWREPDRDGRGPSLTTEAVAKRLQTTSQRIKDLTIIGPEKDGLPGYINLGEAWERKIGKGHGGIQIFYYPEDIQAWDKKHPIREEKNRLSTSYTDEEKATVLAEAEKIKNERGQVSRSKLFLRLRYEPESIEKRRGGIPASKRPKAIPRTDEGYGPLFWNEKTWGRMKQILDDAEIPGLPWKKKAL